MKRPLLLILTFIVAFLLGWFANDAFTFSKAMRNEQLVDYQLRPKNVPKDAFWVGGVDRGSWFLIKHVNSHRNKATIEVYNDQDGSLLASKTFTLICPVDNQILIDNLKDQINSFDGSRIFLTSHNKKAKECYLQ